MLIEHSRLDGLSELARTVQTKDFIAGTVDFDLENPPANPEQYLQLRNNLIQTVARFVEDNKSCTPELKERFATYDSQWEERALWKNSLLLQLKKKHVLRYQQTHEAFEQLEAGRQWLEGQYHSLITENEKLTEKLNRIPRVVRKIFKAQ